MNWFEAIVLGVVQGLTEFLPVSSSGHLVLLQHLFGLEEPELLFDISVHVGTLLAVLVVFYRDLVAMAAGLVRSPRLVREAGGLGSLLRTNDDLRMLLLIVLGCIPTGILGVLFAGMAETLF